MIIKYFALIPVLTKLLLTIAIASDNKSISDEILENLNTLTAIKSETD